MTEPQNYKLISAVLLCITITFFLIITLGVNCNNRVSFDKEKIHLKHKIDSLERLDAKQVLQIDSTKQSRKPINQRIAKRDGTLVEITKRKDEKYKEILADSSDVDFVEFNRILTGLVSEYKIN
jgi:hypothetical protein